MKTLAETILLVTGAIFMVGGVLGLLISAVAMGSYYVGACSVALGIATNCYIKNLMAYVEGK